AVRACFDCHSNETRWPWYSNVAPISWLVQRDVDEGRAELNFSRFDQPQKEAHESAEVVLEGEMPPWFYLPTHPEARLTADEQAELVRGLRATFGGD
ncbi:MAG: heme-binding domain-containing protein, partial [Planctomycetes bacterium]|nr:heme-binding domain-containing protein [Planctomycetota bacterium]